MKGYKRADGRIGIRNHVEVIYTVKCAEHVAKKIAQKVDGVQVFGYNSCYPDPYGFRMLSKMGKHPNVYSTIVVRLGCESTPVDKLVEEIRESGKECELLVIQKDGGTLKTIEKGVEIAKKMIEKAKNVPTVDIDYSDLIIGLECGGSDATSGLAANPVTGIASDLLVEHNGTVILTEIPELLGTEPYLLSKAKNEEVKNKILDGMNRARDLANKLKTFAVSSGNEASGLTTIEEKSLGAMCKAGSKEIVDVIKTAEIPKKPGLYILDKVGTTDTNQLTIYEESDNDGFTTLLASGCQIIIFTTGCGNVVGNVITPVIKVTGNPKKIEIMGDDFDVDASKVILGEEKVECAGKRLFDYITEVASGKKTKAEILGHEEYDVLRKFTRACDVKYI